ncbi:hypothetical protein ARMSODRAFT_1021311 [Armillaria solidipes]|uniref:Protein kinase domain-containing protein n=1 Tax=Armillaria solidipes TaxID=1076256 RepID=A0A2H3BPL7_9AGAR|nr:hypothetical protein ARMSODRAFT_1021311 [Armillaria solidipes]
MGKVKLATHNLTGEQMAVKILPRVNPTATQHSTSATPDSIARQASNDPDGCEYTTERQSYSYPVQFHPIPSLAVPPSWSLTMSINDTPALQRKIACHHAARINIKVLPSPSSPRRQ